MIKLTDEKVVYWNKFNVTEWYKLIEEYTFPSLILQITIEEGKVKKPK
jgi:hypothetical protein